MYLLVVSSLIEVLDCKFSLFKSFLITFVNILVHILISHFRISKIKGRSRLSKTNATKEKYLPLFS